MNSFERVVKTVNFEKTDRIPVIAQVFGHAAVLSNTPLTDYVKSGEILAKCQLNALNCYLNDAVFALMDTSVETEALGSILEYKDGQYPYIKKYALDNGDDLSKLSLPNPLKDGRMPELLKAVKILRKEVNNEVLVVGCTLGPMTLTTQLLGMEKALYLAVDSPDIFDKVIDFATDVIINYGRA